MVCPQAEESTAFARAGRAVTLFPRPGKRSPQDGKDRQAGVFPGWLAVAGREVEVSHRNVAHHGIFISDFLYAVAVFAREHGASRKEPCRH